MMMHSGNFTLSNGASSDKYFDVKGVCASPHASQLICDSFGALLKKYPITCIAGDEGFGPILGGIAHLYHFPYTIVRKEPKERGMKRGLLEYYTPRAHDIVGVVDDVFTTGKSARRIMNAISSQTNARIQGVYVVVNRGNNALFDLPIYSLFRAKDFE